MSEDWATATLLAFQDKTQECGALRVEGLLEPSPRNEIDPMLKKNRWIKGYQQSKHSFCNRMKPAL